MFANKQTSIIYDKTTYLPTTEYQKIAHPE